MNKELQIQLKTACILNIPFQNYGNDFTFVVNGEEFKTSYLISDLISSKISEIHRIDPTLNVINIKTKNKGHFSYILDLLNFSIINLPEAETDFFSEIITILNSNFIEILNINEETELTEENVINNLLLHERAKYLYSKNISKEIDFIALHFFYLCEAKRSELKLLSYDSLYKIISNPNLHLKNEDQLLAFINELVCEIENINYNFLYEFVLFENIESTETIEKFIDIFDYNNLTYENWRSISNRLKQPIKITKEESSTRYERKSRGRSFPTQNFDGIIKYLRSQSNGNIENKVNITTSSLNSSYPPVNVTIFENTEKWFRIRNSGLNNWICFDFKENQVALTDYQLMSHPYGPNGDNLKSWMVEGSNDKQNWEKIDQQNDVEYLNGKSISHTFHVSNSKEFHYIRICNTGPDAAGRELLMLGAVEFYGKLI